MQIVEATQEARVMDETVDAQGARGSVNADEVQPVGRWTTVTSSPTATSPSSITRR